MAGAGYDIGASAASSWSIPQTSNTATVINFGAGASFDLPNSQSVTSEPVSVATTKSPGSNTSVGGTGSGQSNPAGPGTNQPAPLDFTGVLGGNSNTILYIAVAVLATLVIFKRR